MHPNRLCVCVSKLVPFHPIGSVSTEILSDSVAIEILVIDQKQTRDTLWFKCSGGDAAMCGGATVHRSFDEKFMCSHVDFNALHKLNSTC